MSFKVKLVAYFLLVSLLPLGAAGWGLHAVAARSETRRVDVRLQAGLRAVIATYNYDLAVVQARAERLAGNPAFQAALRRRDRAALVRFLAHTPNLRLEARRISLGPPELIGAGSRFSVVARGRVVGTLIAGVPLTRMSLERLRARAGLDDSDVLVVIDRDKVVGGSSALRGAELPPPPRARTVAVGGERHRALAARPQASAGANALALLTPQAQIDHAIGRADRRLLVGLLGSLIL